MSRSIIRILLLFMIALPLSAKTWFVRVDGGTRYSSNVTNGQCDGQTDAAYSGHGTNQHCAFNDVRYMWLDGSMGHGGWVMAGGDTLVIRGCKALRSQQDADAPHCRIGWDKATGNDAQNFWCYYADGYCAMPPPPTGTPAQHTRILGGCAFGSYSCHPVTSYPYTENNLTQLFGGFNTPTLMNMGGSKYVDIEGLELTTHNGQCARYGTTHPLPACRRGGDRPLSDQADQAIATDTGTANIQLQDVYIHGFSASGIVGPIGGPFTLNRVSIDFNAFAAWNFDDGRNTPDAPGSSIKQSYVTMIGNGCQEEYPIKHPQFPAKGCWDSSTGGFGDAWSGQDTNLDAFTCDHCNISYNTKDGAIGPHTRVKDLSLTNSVFAGNMGQQGKWGTQTNSLAWITNNLIVGNCSRLSEPMPGAAQNFNSSVDLPGSGLSGFCRAAGDVFAFSSDAGSTVQIANNTVVAMSPTVWDLNCQTSGNCGSAPYRFTNNIFLGYTNPQSGQTPGLYYKSDPKVVIVSAHNLQYGMRNGDGCGQNGTVCADPQLVGQPRGPRRVGPAMLDNFNIRPLPGSPAAGRGKPVSGLSADMLGHARPAMPSIGAAEPQH